MITTPDLEKYRQGDFVQYMNDLLAILPDARAAALYILKEHAALKTMTATLTDAWKPQYKSDLTPEIIALDKKRDLLFTGFKLTVDNWATAHYKPEWRNAAAMLSDNIERYGKQINTLRYQQQTAKFNAIINDMENELAAALQTLGMEEWVAEIKTLNIAFDNKYVQRAQAVSARQPGMVDTLIGNVTLAFRKLKNIFEARFSIALSDETPLVPDYRQAANEWNILTRQYNEAIHRSNGKKPDEHPGETAAQND